MAEDSLQNMFYEITKSRARKIRLLEGGNNKMDIKSRYEVIADLEEKKRNLIIQKDNLDKNLKLLERELKELNRDVEDKEEEITNYKDSMKQDKETTEELIKSVDASLERLTKISKAK